ncbi:MAG: M48 family metalloprotease [Crocinitomicaceae bacterium]|nr:M48 family metalloprotease [Crocinitomicaceae bacterium]
MRFITLFLLLIAFNSNAQVDFNNYKTLQAKGDIPEDFKEYTYLKVAANAKNKINGLSYEQRNIFLEGIHYSIDNILHSGYVVYGDEISDYVSKIATKLLKDDPEVLSKLRFYTIKSNSTNAFSTDQGIVFVTTGLIAQLSNEAQLAMVLAHEISHYTEKHVLEGFKDKLKNRRTYRTIEELSQYSKDKELNADSLGILLYKNAGYSINEVLPTFDVLMYSYLPFDEVEFPKEYFNTDQFYIPNLMFSSKEYPIKAIEDYDDSESSHPNIKKRKEAAEELIKTLTNWGNFSTQLGQSNFEYIRKIARFESLRTDVLEQNFTDALYSLFILEKDNPNSAYLKRMKAQLWLNLAIYKAENKGDKTSKRTKELEGESAQLHYLIRKLSKEGLTTLAVRQIYDLKKLFPNDEEISKVYANLLKQISNSKSFKLDSYAKKTFSIACLNAIQIADSIKNAVPTVKVEETKTKSKYDKIKNKKNIENDQNFDSTKFYLYGLSDVIQDKKFLENFNYELELVKEQEKEDAAFTKLSKSEKKKWLENKKKAVDINELIIVEPVVQMKGPNGIDPTLSENYQIQLSNTIQEVSSDLNVKTYLIDRTSIKKNGTQIFNERSLLMNYLDQMSDVDNDNILTVDYQLLNTLKENYGTAKVMFTLVQNQVSIDLNPSMVMTSSIFLPLSMVYFPIVIFGSQFTDVEIIILDLETSKVERNLSFYTKEKPTKLKIGAHMYHFFQSIKKK